MSDKLGEIVEPWTARTKAEKQLKSYRRQIEKAAKLLRVGKRTLERLIKDYPELRTAIDQARTFT